MHNSKYLTATFFIQPLLQLKRKKRRSRAHQRSHEHVGGVVHTQMHTAPSCARRPRIRRHRHIPFRKTQRSRSSRRKSKTRMPRWKRIISNMTFRMKQIRINHKRPSPVNPIFHPRANNSIQSRSNRSLYSFFNKRRIFFYIAHNQHRQRQSPRNRHHRSRKPFRNSIRCGRAISVNFRKQFHFAGLGPRSKN